MKRRRRAPSPASTAGYLSREEAIQLLGVKAPTLYTYVSRGLLRSVPGANKKVKLYLREDLERLRARSHARSGERFTANDGLRWGEPIIQTSITQLTGSGPKYRNRLAVELAAARSTFESVAELLWSGTLFDDHVSWHVEAPISEPEGLVGWAGRSETELDVVQIFSMLTLAAGFGEQNKLEIQRGTTVLAARQLIASLVGCLGYISRHRRFVFPEPDTLIAEGVARALAVRPGDDAIGALNAALVLVADHELSPPTFAARVAGSTGASLHACVTSALCTHMGTRVRKACDKVEELFADAPTNSQLRDRLQALERSGARLPGFNHPLYPKGDPRGLALLDLARKLKQQTRQSERFHELLEQEGIVPAPHLARAHWVAVERWDVLRPREIEDELRRAHALIYEKLPLRTKAVLALPEKERARAIRERRKLAAARDAGRREGEKKRRR